MENTETEVCSTNLQKLKQLVDELDNHHQKSDEYQEIIQSIEKVIRKEKKVISQLIKTENKLAHYENICAAILSIISTAKVS